MAAAEDPAERARLHGMLASQLEVAFNQIGNSTQVVLWDVQEKAYQKIDHLQEQVGNGNTLLSGVIDALNGLRADVQASAAESAARLGKCFSEIETLHANVNDMDVRHSGQWEEAMGLLAASAADRADLRERINMMAADRLERDRLIEEYRALAAEVADIRAQLNRHAE